MGDKLAFRLLEPERAGILPGSVVLCHAVICRAGRIEEGIMSLQVHHAVAHLCFTTGSVHTIPHAFHGMPTFQWAALMHCRRPSSQQTSPISVPRHRISKMEPFTAGFATVDELGEEVEGDDDDTQSGSEGRQQANHSPPASPDRPEKGRRRATFAVPEHQHPVQEGDRPQHSLGHEIEQVRVDTCTQCWTCVGVCNVPLCDQRGAVMQTRINLVHDVLLRATTA